MIRVGEGELGDVKGEDFMGVDFHQFISVFEQREQLVRNNPSLLDIPSSGLDRGDDLYAGFPHSPRVLRALLLKERQHFLFKELIRDFIAHQGDAENSLLLHSNTLTGSSFQNLLTHEILNKLRLRRLREPREHLHPHYLIILLFIPNQCPRRRHNPLELLLLQLTRK